MPKILLPLEQHSHVAIIEPAEFKLVQTELVRRKELGKRYSCSSPFSTKIVCGECGEFYGSKVWHSTSKYKRTIWQCNAKFKNQNKCSTPHLNEDEIKVKFLTAFNTLMESKDEMLENCRLIQVALADCTSIDTEIDSLLCEIDVITELTKKCIEENSQNAIDQNEYISRYDGYVQRYKTTNLKLEKQQLQRQQRLIKHDAIGAFMFELHERVELLTKFDERLWNMVIDKVTMNHDGRLMFEFKNGMEIVV